MKHTLIIRPGALGDAVLTLPALEALRASSTRVRILGTPTSWKFLRPEANVDVLDFGAIEWTGLFSADLSAPARAVLADTSTAIVYLPDAAEITRTLARAGVERVYAVDPPLRNERALGPKSSDLRGSLEPSHAARRLLDPLAELLGEEAVAAALDKDSDLLRPSSTLSVSTPKLPEHDMVVLHPGSGGKDKCWPIERFAYLSHRLASEGRVKPVILSGPAEEYVAEYFSHSDAPVLHALPLREVCAVLARAKLFIGNDAGITHLAARFCPTLALFGPTDPRVWKPIGATVRVAQPAIAPCGMEHLDTLEIWRIAYEMLWS